MCSSTKPNLIAFALTSGLLLFACGGNALPAPPYSANLPGSKPGGCWNGGSYAYVVEAAHSNSPHCPDLPNARLSGSFEVRDGGQNPVIESVFEPSGFFQSDGGNGVTKLFASPSDAGTYDPPTCTATVSWSQSSLQRLNGCPAITTHVVTFDTKGGVSGTLQIVSTCDADADVGTSISCTYTTTASAGGTG
jgi:hypothetical protein